jgi:hypothetical protein
LLSDSSLWTETFEQSPASPLSLEARASVPAGD